MAVSRCSINISAATIGDGIPLALRTNIPTIDLSKEHTVEELSWFISMQRTVIDRLSIELNVLHTGNCVSKKVENENTPMRESLGGSVHERLPLDAEAYVIIESLKNCPQGQIDSFIKFNPLPILFSAQNNQIVQDLPPERVVEYASASFRQMGRAIEIRNIVGVLDHTLYDDHFLQTVAQLTDDIFRPSNSKVLLLPDQRKNFKYVFDSDDFFTSNEKDGIVQEACNRRSVLLLENTEESEYYYPPVDEDYQIGSKSSMLIPIMGIQKDQVMAVIITVSEGGLFTPEDATLAQILAEHLSIYLSAYARSIFMDLTVTNKPGEAQPQVYIPELPISHYAEKALERVEQDLGDLQSLSFDILLASPDARIMNILTMYLALGLSRSICINIQTLTTFLFSLRGCYTNTPYHNWSHACDVNQFVFYCIKKANLSSILKDEEILALFLASICHDVGHRGLNNAYHRRARTALGILYGKASIMEMHHAATSTRLLFMSENQILNKIMTPQQRSHFYEFFLKIIFATDMEHHKEYIEQFTEISTHFDKTNKGHRLLLAQMIMKAGDLSNTTRPFQEAMQMALFLREECFLQGDLEKKLGLEVAQMNDRDRAGPLYVGQIGFYTAISRPLFELVVQVLPELAETVENIDRNLEEWRRVGAECIDQQ